jgi:DivIVA domain-containing protein
MDQPLFARVRWREGYDMAQVDAFVERLLATVEGRYVDRPVTADEIHQVSFTPVRLTHGYSIEEVDAFLDTAESLLRKA